MSLPKCKDFTDYNKYPSEDNPTTDAQMQEYMDNQNQLMKAASAMMWQPSSEYEVGDIVVSPAMPANTEAVCVTAGMSDSALEPSWTMESNIPDGSCFWKLRYVHYTSFLATEEEAAAGTDTEKIMTPAAVKAAVGSMNAASATELIKTNPISKGGTGATTQQGARQNLGVDTAIIDASVDGKTITLTLADGTTKTLTTQDTAPFTASATAIGGASKTTPAVVVTSYRNGNNWYRVWSDGWVEQGGLLTETGSGKTISLHKPMADTNYTAQITLLGKVTGTCYAPFVHNTSTTTITFYGNGNTVLNANKVWVVYGKGA